MCGICGKLNFDRHEPVDPGLLRRMTKIMYHRGPDGEGEYRSGPIGLGHRRLSIIDLDTGNQPIANEDGTVWIVYNGEVYNFPELRADLHARGHRFKSATDTEVIVHLYEELGEGAVERLRGMFAFALWDERKKMLLLARDRVGIKPLYYCNTGKSFLFASEIKSIILDPAVSRKVNPVALDRFITYHYLPGKETLFEGIYKLDPGYYLTIQDGRVSVHEYWDLRFDRVPHWRDFDEAVEGLRDLLRRTVRDHMISDVPVGVLLSGGVDSTGVLRYAVEESGKPIHTFTIGFAGEKFADERPYARLAAQRYGTVHQDITMSAKDFRDFLPKYIWHMEEPIVEPPAIALYFVANLARKAGIKVLLSGEGGDEAFGGYQNYRNLLLLERLKSAFGPAKALLRFSFSALRKAGFERIGHYGDLVDRPLSQYYLSRTTTDNKALHELKKTLYTKEFAELLKDKANTHPTHRLFGRLNGQSPLNQMLYVDTKSWLPDDLLVKADKMTMATSVELRVPLLDSQVLEFAASLPQQYKVSGWRLKRILKVALKESVPREILQRKKTGFPVPYETWLLGELKGFVCETVMRPNALIGRYFNLSEIEYIIRSHQERSGLSKFIFSLLVMAFWQETFIGISS